MRERIWARCQKCWRCIGETRLFKENEPFNLISVYPEHDKISESLENRSKGCDVFKNHTVPRLQS
jgi:hypothetical protein